MFLLKFLTLFAFLWLSLESAGRFVGWIIDRREDEDMQESTGDQRP